MILVGHGLREGGKSGEGERGEEKGEKEREIPEDGRGCKCRNAHTNSGFTYEARFLNVEEK